MRKFSNDVDFAVGTEEKIETKKSFDIQIRVRLSLGFIEDVNILLNRYNKPTGEIYYKLGFIRKDDTYAYFGTKGVIDEPGVYYFCFALLINNQKRYVVFDKNSGQAKISSDRNQLFWHISVGFDAPDWAKGAIMYHIFLDRFYRSKRSEKLTDLPKYKNRTIHYDWNEDPVVGADKNGNWNADFYGGDINGIIDKLDYIQSLGVSIIYVSPIVESASNHRYDAGDYELIDPYAGRNEDLKKLCDLAHKRKMHVIIDAVFNHTGRDSKYFNAYGTYNSLGASQSKNSPYYNWYRKDNKGNFMYWWDMKNLPETDGNNFSWQNFIYGEGGIIDKWFDLGIDGLRLDVADELTDDFIENIRIACKRNKEDSFIIGEVWKNPVDSPRGYIKSGKGMDSVMNYFGVDAAIRYIRYGDYGNFKSKVKDIIFNYPFCTINTLMNFTSTHDISRMINIFGSPYYRTDLEWIWDLPDDKKDRKWQKNNDFIPGDMYIYGKMLSKLYSVMMMFMPGIFSIFYGDEVGITGYGNIINRKSFPWDRDNDGELYKFFCDLGRVYNSYPFLKEARVRIISIDEKVLVFERYKEDDSILVAINRTGEKLNFLMPEKYKDDPNLKLIFEVGDSKKDTLEPYGALVFKN